MEKGITEDRGKLSTLWAVLNESSEGYILCNKNGTIIYFNQKAKEIIQAITGHSINSGDLMHFIVPEYLREYFNTLFQKATGGTQCESDRIVKLISGEWLRLSVKYIPALDAEGKIAYVYILVKDITKEKNLEEIIHLHREVSAKLLEINTINEALNYILDISIEKTEMDCGGVYLKNEVTDDFDLIVHKGLGENFVKNSRIVKKGSPRWNLVMKGITLNMQHWEYDSNPDDSLLKENLKMVVLFPVKYRSNLIASINIGSHALEYFPERSKEILNLIGTETAIAISRILTEEKLNQANKIISELKNFK